MTERMHVCLDTSIVSSLDDFDVLRPLGKGGMGEVYEVQASDGTHLALKVFSNKGEHAAFLKKRFLAEGKLLARLDHPRLVRVHHLSVDKTREQPYFTMDLILGPSGEPQTLADVRREQSLDEGRIAALYEDLREGLSYLHGQGVVHRDVKLENVLIDAEGRAVLSDFGISRIFDEKLKAVLAVTTTMTGEKAPIMGSFGYLAPELKRGESATPSSDAYALGVLVFRLLTGVWYEADSTARDLLSGLDPAWTELLAQLLNEVPSKRLPLPKQIPLGQAAKHRRIVRVAVILTLVGAAFAALLAFMRTRPPTYSFDEFFPEERAEQ